MRQIYYSTVCHVVDKLCAPLAILSVAAVAIYHRTDPRMPVLLLGALATHIATKMLKTVIGKHRPRKLRGGGGPQRESYGMPSTHATNLGFLSLVGVLGLLCKSLDYTGNGERNPFSLVPNVVYHPLELAATLPLSLQLSLDWTDPSQWQVLLQAASLLFGGVLLSLLRWYEEHHTFAQVAVGIVLGYLQAGLWWWAAMLLVAMQRSQLCGVYGI